MPVVHGAAQKLHKSLKLRPTLPTPLSVIYIATRLFIMASTPSLSSVSKSSSDSTSPHTPFMIDHGLFQNPPRKRPIDESMMPAKSPSRLFSPRLSPIRPHRYTEVKSQARKLHAPYKLRHGHRPPELRFAMKSLYNSSLVPLVIDDVIEVSSICCLLMI